MHELYALTPAPLLLAEAAGASHSVEIILILATVGLMLATVVLAWITARLAQVTNKVAVIEMRKIAQTAVREMHDVSRHEETHNA